MMSMNDILDLIAGIRNGDLAVEVRLNHEELVQHISPSIDEENGEFLRIARPTVSCCETSARDAIFVFPTNNESVRKLISGTPTISNPDFHRILIYVHDDHTKVANSVVLDPDTLEQHILHCQEALAYMRWQEQRAAEFALKWQDGRPWEADRS